MFSYNLVLIGFMGTGKSTVAKYLSKQYHMDIIEMDALIEQREGMSIPEIFQVHGEPYFRSLETNLLKEMQNYENKIISCGGGAALRERKCPGNEKERKSHPPYSTSGNHSGTYQGGQLPPSSKKRKNPESITLLMEQRREKYLAAADISVATDNKSISEICEEIIEKLVQASTMQARSHKA